MATSKDITSALAAKQPAPASDLTTPVPPKRPLPAPMLSTDMAAAVEASKTPKPRRGDGKKRPPRGYTLDLDLVKQFQHLAIDEGKPLYEVMEEAMREFLERRHQEA